MKLASFLLLPMLFALPASTGHSQNNAKKEIVSLDLGSVTISLGMPKKDVLKKLSDESYNVIETDQNQSIADYGGHFYSLHFRNERLTYADREWYTKGSEVEDAILNGLGALADQSTNKPCAVVHSPQSDPDLTSNRIFVSCGQRNLLIGKYTIQGKTSLMVSESIGELPKRKQ